ncbi:adenosylcobinamide-phosphate synthase CbiB [Dysgonomonas sp. Marseille-P4361]|uniref:adenosylcobinamide-phosphate synthase CbiB n=1 Tax=Dysgonomonas sp. Marseille-P4361 TaxID=2161820 RepID=UPI000D555915|nr:adenosylcobinamide-phosphate synthase CbiB [Dysgonomonas sp. Marseille-P4361]
MDITVLYVLVPLILGWVADLILGDPASLPHPIVGFGKIISWGEKILNKGKYRLLKGALFAVILIICSFSIIYFLLQWTSWIHPYITIVLSAIIVFYCLAGKTLINEVRQVFVALDSSVEEGREQVGRIVGRNTTELSPQQIRTAALETLSENLSDGVIAPLFWFMILGAPGMFAYKMINTLDSMIGYRSERYKYFGCWAARIDDVANYIPARLTAFLMILVSGQIHLLTFVKKYATQHLSPNSGYPEAALAGILNCRFGGTHTYLDKIVVKPYIGEQDKILDSSDMETAIMINKRTELLMFLVVVCYCLTLNIIIK